MTSRLEVPTGFVPPVPGLIFDQPLDFTREVKKKAPLPVENSKPSTNASLPTIATLGVLSEVAQGLQEEMAASFGGLKWIWNLMPTGLKLVAVAWAVKLVWDCWKGNGGQNIRIDNHVEVRLDPLLGDLKIKNLSDELKLLVKKNPNVSSGDIEKIVRKCLLNG